MKKLLPYFLTFLLLITTPLYAALPPTRILDEGVDQGVAFKFDCVGTGIECTRTGTTGTLTVNTGAGGGDLSAVDIDTSAELDAIVTDNTGSGALVFNNAAIMTGLTVKTSLTLDYATASELVATNASKELVSLAVATYPSLTELSYVKGLSSAVQTQITAAAKRSVSFTITNGDTAIDDTVTDPIACTGRIPYTLEITRWDLNCDQSGSIVLDVWKNTWDDTPEANGDSIAGTEKPTLAADVSASDTSLDSMTTTWSAGDNVCIEVESASTVTKCWLTFSE